MFEKVCFLVNYNLYESKRHFTKMFGEAMERAGIEVMVIDVGEKQIDREMFDTILRFAPDFTASFNSFVPSKQGKYLWDMLRIPHLSILVDPSLYSVNLINSPYSIVSCVDKFDCEGLRTQDFDRVFFLAHAVEKDLFEEDVQEKEYDVVFIGSCYDYENLRDSWRKKLSEPICLALDIAIERVLGQVEVSLHEALVDALNQNPSINLQEVDLFELFYYLDYYTRGVDRVELIRSITDAHVHIFGELSTEDPSAENGWNHYLMGMKNVTIHPSVTFSESMEILKRSRISLNSDPFFKNGSHERLFTGPACGAVVVTNDNLFVRDAFVDGEDIVLFRSKHWEEVGGKVRELLADESKCEAILKAARKKVLEWHTWDVRVKELREQLPKFL